MERKNGLFPMTVTENDVHCLSAVLVRNFVCVRACVLIKLTKAQTSLIFVLFFRFFFFANVN